MHWSTTLKIQYGFQSLIKGSTQGPEITKAMGKWPVGAKEALSVITGHYGYDPNNSVHMTTMFKRLLNKAGTHLLSAGCTQGTMLSGACPQGVSS